MPPRHSNMHGRGEGNNHGRNTTVNAIAPGHNGHGLSLGDVQAKLDLISFWELEEGSGQTRVDQMGNNNLAETSPAPNATAIVGNGADLLGEYLFKASPTLQDDSFTVGGWCRPDNNAQLSAIISHFNDTGNQRSWVLFGINNELSIPAGERNRFRFSLSSTGSDDFSKSAEDMSAISNGQFYFVVGWYDGSDNSVNIQVDNGAVNTNSSGPSSLHASTHRLELGNIEPFQILDGVIDQVFYYNRVLTQAERTFLYNDGNGRSFAEL